MIKKFFATAGILFFSQVFAQTIPPLPGPITPSTKDNGNFVCQVTSINADEIERSINFWTKAAVGGKFQAISPIKLRVKSESATKAEVEVFDFYKKYAASAFIRSPFYDKGTRLTQKYVVSKCEVDATRATNVNLKDVPLDAYKPLITDEDHILNFLALNQSPLSDEQIAALVSRTPFSLDAFERREEIQKVASKAKSEIKNTPGRFVILEGMLFLGEYDFESKSFDLSKLKPDAEKYTYRAPRGSATRTPIYDLTVPAQLLTYTPSSLEEAKKIERARAKQAYMKLKTYIQINNATGVQGPLVKATIATIEVRTDGNELLFRASAK
jgi:hypothetical protein